MIDCGTGDTIVSTHSRLKAAGLRNIRFLHLSKVSTHSRLKAAGTHALDADSRQKVSTHSRLKAAGRRDPRFFMADACFNTQPPEGGWVSIS